MQEEVSRVLECLNIVISLSLSSIFQSEKQIRIKNRIPAHFAVIYIFNQQITREQNVKFAA